MAGGRCSRASTVCRVMRAFIFLFPALLRSLRYSIRNLCYYLQQRSGAPCAHRCSRNAFRSRPRLRIQIWQLLALDRARALISCFTPRNKHRHQPARAHFERHRLTNPRGLDGHRQREGMGAAFVRAHEFLLCRQLVMVPELAVANFLGDLYARARAA